jgi:hypothetical protein
VSDGGAGNSYCVVPNLKNVLTEAKGIKTGDLFPDVAALQQMQAYMHKRMGIGQPIAMDRFVDLRFSEKAYRPCN